MIVGGAAGRLGFEVVADRGGGVVLVCFVVDVRAVLGPVVREPPPACVVGRFGVVVPARVWAGVEPAGSVDAGGAWLVVALGADVAVPT